MSRLILFVLAASPVFAGDLTQRAGLTWQRITAGGPPFYSAEFVSADAIPNHVRRFTEFSGDVSGRYLEAVSVWARQYGGAPKQLGEVASAVIRAQNPDGHVGGPMSEGTVTNKDMAILWGNGRLLVGLVEYYRFSHRAEALSAAQKLAGFLVKIAPLMQSDRVRSEFNGEKFAVGYICWTQVIEGLVELYREAPAPAYLAVARQIAAVTDRHPSQHSHGFLTTLRGIVALSRATGESRYLDQVEREWQALVKSENVMPTGAVPEMFAPQMKRDEGCSEADWLRLNLLLWQATRKPEYLAQAERALFNEFSFNQFRSGDFGHHTFSAAGYGPGSARAWWCCTFHGMRAFSDVFMTAFHASGENAVYDLPVDGDFAGASFALHAESSLEKDGTVRIEVKKAPNQARTLKVRVPDWGTVEPAEITRVFKPGELITLRYTMRTREIRRANQVAIFLGPWLMAVDQETSAAYYDEPMDLNRVSLPAEPAGTNRLRVRFLPGGYPVQPQSVMLRPIAEHTFGPDGDPVEFWLTVP